MNYTNERLIALDMIAAKVGFIDWAKEETTSDTPTVLKVITPDDNSAGFIEVRYAAACDDGGTIQSLIGIKRVPYTKTAGYVTLGTETDEYLVAGAGSMAASELTIAANTDTIEISGTGVLDTVVSWDIIPFINSAIAQIILP
jgi:hypothetical protein